MKVRNNAPKPCVALSTQSAPVALSLFDAARSLSACRPPTSLPSPAASEIAYTRFCNRFD